MDYRVNLNRPMRIVSLNTSSKIMKYVFQILDNNSGIYFWICFYTFIKIYCVYIDCCIQLNKKQKLEILLSIDYYLLIYDALVHMIGQSHDGPYCCVLYACRCNILNADDVDTLTDEDLCREGFP